MKDQQPLSLPLSDNLFDHFLKKNFKIKQNILYIYLLFILRENNL